MNKFELSVVALLGAIAIDGAICAAEIRKIARNGFNMELSMEQADSLATSVRAAREAALEDIKVEGEENV